MLSMLCRVPAVPSGAALGRTVPCPAAGPQHLLVRGEAAARELPPVVNLPPANPFWTASAVQKGTVSIFCQLQLT